MSSRRWLLALVIVGLLVISSWLPPYTAAQATCTIGDRFTALRDQIPEIVGECLADEAVNPATGNIEQPTTGGTLIWLATANIATFSDGTTTWLVGPEGLVSRPNDAPPFPWEAPAAQDAPQSEGSEGEAPAAGPAPKGAPAPSAGPPRIGRIYWAVEPDGTRRAETDAKSFKCCPYIYTFYDFYDVTPPNRLSAYVNRNDEDFSRAGPGFTPRNPNGWARGTAWQTDRPAGGSKFTLIVLINGQEAARGDVIIE